MEEDEDEDEVEDEEDVLEEESFDAMSAMIEEGATEDVNMPSDGPDRMELVLSII